MNTRYAVLAGAVIVLVTGGVYAGMHLQKEADEQQYISPCTGTVVETPPTPCVIDTHEIPESGQGFFFKYPDDVSVIQSGESVSTIEHSLLDEQNQEIMDGPFYLITFYYGETVTMEAFNAMFPNGTTEAFKGKSAIKSTTANFPNPEYPFTTAYYLTNNDEDTIAIVAGYDRDMLAKAEQIFAEGFRWEDADTDTTTFDFELKYGVRAKNVMNTFNDTFTKDMIVDSPITISLSLSENELNTIQQAAHDLGLFEPTKTTVTNVLMTPCDDYDLTMQEHGTEYHVAVDCDAQESNPSLEQFVQQVRAIIEAKSAYKALPEPQGGYL